MFKGQQGVIFMPYLWASPVGNRMMMDFFDLILKDCSYILIIVLNKLTFRMPLLHPVRNISLVTFL